MTSFAHVDHPTAHRGADRVERVLDHAAQAKKRLVRSGGVRSLLLAAMVATFVVVANQVIDNLGQGHLLAGWVALWVIAFTALALLAEPARIAARGWRVMALRRRVAAQDQRYWDVALQDARVMAEISRAMTADAAVDVRRLG